MNTSFTKYQSLGNDFILFDWYTESKEHIRKLITHKNWSTFVARLCKRMSGIGADGVLILKQTQSGIFKNPELLIFNADGSDGGLCLNGARCAAHHLHTQHQLSESFHIFMRNKKIDCQIESNGQISISLLMTHPPIEKKVIQTDCGTFEGHMVNIGNPHFVVMQQTSPNWLEKNGCRIESHPTFPDKTNVEFVWLPKIVKKKEFPSFSTIVYERGCGLTQACSSGAVAITACLAHENIIKKDTTATFIMPGGKLSTHYSGSKVIVCAPVNRVFTGQIEKFA